LRNSRQLGIEFKLIVLGRERGMWDRLLSIILITIITGALGALGYVIATAGGGEDNIA